MRCRKVVEVVVRVLEVVTVPVSRPGGEARLDAPVLEADAGHDLPVSEPELGDRELYGLVGGHVGAPEPPSLVAELPSLALEPRVVVPV